jgi:hypothetical protein
MTVESILSNESFLRFEKDYVVIECLILMGVSRIVVIDIIGIDIVLGHVSEFRDFWYMYDRGRS